MIIRIITPISILAAVTLISGFPESAMSKPPFPAQPQVNAKVKLGCEVLFEDAVIGMQLPS